MFSNIVIAVKILSVIKVEDRQPANLSSIHGAVAYSKT